MSSMEFFGAEVKSGEPCKVFASADSMLHLSQAALGEVTGDVRKDKGNESVRLYLRFGASKFVIGTLSHDKHQQIPLDLIFEKEIELSHNWKNGSVYFAGYYVNQPSHDSESESEEELAPVENNPKSKVEKTNATATDANAVKQVKIVTPEDEDTSDDDDDDDDDDTSDEDDEQDRGLLANGENDSDEEESEDESSDEDEETPEKAEPSKKRSAESNVKTPVPAKKSKVDTPHKTDGKKVGGHVATPYPSKQATKASTSSGQTKQTPKLGGLSHVCKSCGRSFGSENALQSHSKAKHGSAA